MRTHLCSLEIVRKENWLLKASSFDDQILILFFNEDTMEQHIVMFYDEETAYHYIERL